MRSPFWVGICLLVGSTVSNAQPIRSLVSNSQATNKALIVSAANGLSGLEFDIKNIQEIGANEAYGFKDTVIENDNATVPATIVEISKVARDVGDDGTFFFYYTGHGSKTGLYMGDQNYLTVKDIRKAIEEGRKGLGPVDRLVVMFDSCYSGALVDPIRKHLLTPEIIGTEIAAQMANSLVDGLRDGERTYWNSLFVFASSTAEQTSMASPEGSIFTLALRKAFDETAQANGNMGKLVELTKKYTKGHDPVERFVPETMRAEPLLGQ